MAGTLQVENLIGPTTGANANKVIIPSGQTLAASGHVIKVTYGTHNAAGLSHSSTSWTNYTNSNITVTKTLGPGNTAGGSVLMIIGHAWIEYSANANAKHLSYSIMRDGNEVTGLLYGLGNLYSASAGGYQSSADVSFVDTGNFNAGSTFTYSMCTKANNSSSIQIGNGERLGTWQILEIAV